MAHKKGIEMHLTPKTLRRLRKKDLKKLDHVQFVISKHRTLAVLMPYDQFCEIKGMSE